MNNPFDNYQAPQSEDKLTKVRALGEEARNLEKILEALAEESKELTSRLNQIKTQELPAMLTDIGMKSFKLLDGTEVKIEDVVAGSLPKDEEKRSEALKWIDSVNPDIIKTNVELSFGRGQDNVAKNAIAMLEESGYEPLVEKGVHAQTLCAFARERLKNGEELPIETLGLYVGKTTKFGKGKKK